MAGLPSSGGIGPLNWLLSRRRNVRLASLPKDAGIDPDNWFSQSCRTCRLARLPSSGGIGPLNWLSQRDSSVTRPLASVVTPCHWLMGASLSQFALFVQLGPLVAL